MKYKSIFIGFDERERGAYNVARASIESRSTVPLHVQSIKLSKLKKLGILNRPIEQKDGKMWCPISQAPVATEFAFSRFGIPFLQREGWALFVDCDILCLSDIKELFDLADDKYAVMVVKHKHDSGVATKMDAQAQVYYSRKNWSSVMLFNCGHPAHQKLTKEALNTWPGRDLHAFKWLSDEEIGALPTHWNWLVNVTPGIPERKGIWHYTLGGPWFPNWKPTVLDDAWLAADKARLAFAATEA